MLDTGIRSYTGILAENLRQQHLPTHATTCTQNVLYNEIEMKYHITICL